MLKEIFQAGVGLIERIADGSLGNVELDKGGHWSEKYGIWVDTKFKEFVSHLTPEEQTMMETFANIGLATAGVFNRQIRDAEQGLMWPAIIFEEGGADLLAHLIANKGKDDLTLGLADPYATFGQSGFDGKALPYSTAYHEEFAPLITQLEALIELPGAQPYKDYLEALLTAYKHQPTKSSDFTNMHKADEAWVRIPSTTALLFLAEPTEVYLDRARVALGQNPRIAAWTAQVEKQQGLSPWKTFMEFRLLVKDESMITAEEIASIRRTSRTLFASSQDQEVPVSLEFRRLLIAAGNGAHPAKTAKNYPNQANIRERIGYKNVLYTNMIEMGVYDHIIPSLKAAFTEGITSEISMEQLIRGSVLRVVGHEENHPFRRFTDSPLEELKSTVNGIRAIIKAGFNEDDIKATILTEIGVALHVRSRVNLARTKGDKLTERTYEAYSKGDTMLMNALWNNQAFLLNDASQVAGIDYEKAVEAITKLGNNLDAARTGDGADTVPLLYQQYGSENVWDNFKLSLT